MLEMHDEFATQTIAAVRWIRSIFGLRMGITVDNKITSGTVMALQFHPCPTSATQVHMTLLMKNGEEIVKEWTQELCLPNHLLDAAYAGSEAQLKAFFINQERLDQLELAHGIESAHERFRMEKGNGPGNGASEEEQQKPEVQEHASEPNPAVPEP